VKTASNFNQQQKSGALYVPDLLCRSTFMEENMIHKFAQNGYNLLLDVNSGSVHVLDGLSFDLVEYAGEGMSETMPEAAADALLDKYGISALRESWAELYSLFCEERLYSKDGYEAYGNAGKDAPIKSMCLNIAHDCNLRCSYCFASTGDFGGERKLMPFEVGRAALDFLFENSASRHNLEVDFFGGEPLMNFDVVKELVAYGRSQEKLRDKKIRFTITTNAMLLDDDKIDFINREMSNVVLSVDGRKEVNDRMRVRADGSGSYDAIMPAIKKLVDGRCGRDYYVRGTFTRENLDFAADVLHLADEGFDQISIEPAVSDAKDAYSLREEDLPVIFEEYEFLAIEIIKRKKEGRGFNFFHFMIDLDGGPCLIKLMRGCGCGNEYVAVTPEGDIYPCHQFVGQQEYLMGSVMNGGLTRLDIKKRFGAANIIAKEGCTGCWARFFCSGGCNANNNAFAGDIMKPMHISCEMEKKRLECALMIKAALAE
jgi:uncharacterized protein